MHAYEVKFCAPTSISKWSIMVSPSLIEMYSPQVWSKRTMFWGACGFLACSVITTSSSNSCNGVARARALLNGSPIKAGMEQTRLLIPKRRFLIHSYVVQMNCPTLHSFSTKFWTSNWLRISFCNPVKYHTCEVIAYCTPWRLASFASVWWLFPFKFLWAGGHNYTWHPAQASSTHV